MILAGDLTTRGQAEQARTIVRLACQHSCAVVAVCGNGDSRAVEKTLIEEDVSLHTRTRQFGEWVLLGLSGVPGGLPWQYRFSEKLFEDWLEKMSQDTSHVTGRILVTHTPPKGLRDKTRFRTHAGSRSVRARVENHSPSLVICGHIHEPHGEEQFGATRGDQWWARFRAATRRCRPNTRPTRH
ncbi:metallophosphoesterase [bacterium]|nr:metallophosphoesterase [bacterium]